MSAPPSFSGPLLPDVSRGYQYLTAQWVSVSIAIIFVVLRIGTRKILFKTLKLDDYAILVALVNSD